MTTASNDAPALIKSVAEPQLQSILAGQIRHALTAAAGAGFIASAYDTSSNSQMLAGMLASVLMQGIVMAWSWLQKWSAARHAHQAAVASAANKVPLQPNPAA